jgi:hypothetical protein
MKGLGEEVRREGIWMGMGGKGGGGEKRKMVDG